MKWTGTVKLLIYNFAYHSEAGVDVENVVNGILKDPHEGLSKDDYVRHIQSALASTDDLSKILPDSPPNDEIRRFLKSVLERLIVS